MNGQATAWMDYHARSSGFGPLSIFIRKLLNRSMLSANDQSAIAALPLRIQSFRADATILREGDRPGLCPILLAGFVYRYKLSAGGGRQIVALKMPGDALDLQSAFLHTADHNIRTVTAATIAMVPLADVEALVQARPAIARAALIDILLEGSISREWLLNIGRRTSEQRVAHLLCEIFYRADEIAGLPIADFDIPFTQEQLADLLGLTPVHINRMLKSLERAGAVERRGRRLFIRDLAALETISDFSGLYLHRSDLADNRY